MRHGLDDRFFQRNHPYPPSAQASARTSASASARTSASAGTSTSASAGISTSASASADISTSASEEKSWVLVRSGKGSGFTDIEKLTTKVKLTTSVDVSLYAYAKNSYWIHISFKDATGEFFKIQIPKSKFKLDVDGRYQIWLGAAKEYLSYQDLCKLRDDMTSNKLVQNFLSALLMFSGQEKPSTKIGTFSPFKNKKGFFWKLDKTVSNSERIYHEHLNPDAIVFIYPENFLPNIQDMICEAPVGECSGVENYKGQYRKSYSFLPSIDSEEVYTILEYNQEKLVHYYVEDLRHDNVFYEIKPTEATLKKLKEFEDYKDE
eukprot:GHVP01022419.1.p1 GENE.GHVP01022419.1~~GHVP01022419.1.p1  ORF type:complete len:320 (+),score=46.29 GHVP01022419.1:183-1142(+)